MGVEFTAFTNGREIQTGAEVRVVQKSTNVIRTTRSNEAGGYEVPGLLPDIYRVEATQPGFKGAVVDEINVTSGRRVEINLTMTIGEVKEAAGQMIGKTLVTHQSGPAGKKVKRVYVEAGCASGGAALWLAASHVASGQCDTALVFGIEKMPKGMIRSSFFDPWREEAGLS